MIVILCGRKHSGKSLIANFLLSKGFKKISFANSLKELCSNLFNIELSKFYDPQAKEEKFANPFIIDSVFINRLNSLTNLNIPFIQDKSISSIREAMQYIGSDLIRVYDPEYHIKNTISKMIPGQNYICDDCRFPNELTALKEQQAISFFIIRPNNFEISNHLSEISISWKDCDYTIVNNRNEEYVLKKFNKIYDNVNYIPKFDKIPSKEILENLLSKNQTKEVAEILNCSRDKVVWWANKYGIHLDHCKYFYDREAFLTPSKEAAYFAGLLSADGCIKKSGKSDNNYVLELTSKDAALIRKFKKFVKTNKPISTIKNDDGTYYSIVLHSAFIIENLKRWNLKPKKSKNNEIPDIIKDTNLIKYWFVGLIDGDGSIYKLKKNQHVRISVLASEQVIDYMSQYLSIKSSKSSEKNIENLYCLRFGSKASVTLYKSIFGFDKFDLGLPRKWNKIYQVVEKEKSCL